MYKKKVLFLLFILVISGCAKKQIVKQQESMIPQQQVTKEDDNEPSVRSGDWQSVPQIKTIYFDYDSTNLRQDARDILKNNAKYLKNTPNIEVIVEGHCDERGTTEYNLGLGQRRAAAVREYYNRLGIKLNKIGTISYGEEKPAVHSNSEDAWAKNRRAETKVRPLNK